jgi:hypothetical protein
MPPKAADVASFAAVAATVGRCAAATDVLLGDRVAAGCVQPRSVQGASAAEVNAGSAVQALPAYKTRSLVGLLVSTNDLRGEVRRLCVIVFSDGPIGPTAIAQISVVDVIVYVEHLEAAGHDNIRIGTGEGEAIPFRIWRAEQKLNRTEADRDSR